MLRGSKVLGISLRARVDEGKRDVLNTDAQFIFLQQVAWESDLSKAALFCL